MGCLERHLQAATAHSKAHTIHVDVLRFRISNILAAKLAFQITQRVFGMNVWEHWNINRHL
jgi:hypothetical protein